MTSFIKGNYEGGESIGLFANDTQMASYATKNGLIPATEGAKKASEELTIAQEKAMKKQQEAVFLIPFHTPVIHVVTVFQILTIPFFKFCNVLIITLLTAFHTLEAILLMFSHTPLSQLVMVFHTFVTVVEIVFHMLAKTVIIGVKIVVAY